MMRMRIPLLLAVAASGSIGGAPAWSQYEVAPFVGPPKIVQTCGKDSDGRYVVQSDDVVRIMIDKGFDVTKRVRQVRFQKGGDRYDPDSVATPDPTPTEDYKFGKTRQLAVTNPPDAFRRNPYHFSNSEIVRPNLRSPIKIVVFIKDKRYKFHTDDIGGAQAKGVIISTDTPDPMFCYRDDPISEKKGFSVLTFYMQPTGAPPGMVGRLNFMVVPRGTGKPEADWGTGTPILIDPKIKNDG